MVDEHRPRLSLQSLQVLRVLLERPERGLAGSDIRRVTGLASGTLYPILARLEQAGWLKSWWEEIDPREVGRPRKRFYCVTPVGARNAADAFLQLDFPEGSLAWT